MSKAISYSLFGYDGERAENCFSFSSYLRGLMLCLRFNRLIYPEWQSVLNTDHATYGAFEPLFKALEDKGTLIVKLNKNGAQLCEAMLWRLKPIYHGGYTHVLCRDLDSLSTYRERQAVQYWVDQKTKAAHAITDSVSHDLPMLGGMIGFMPEHFTTRTGTNDFTSLINLKRMDFSTKGSDQTFLNQALYPLFAEKGSDTITQHYFNGYSNTFLSDYHTCTCPPPSGHRADCPNNYPVNLPDDLRESNAVCGHIGASGWYSTATDKFLRKHKDKFLDFQAIELQYDDIFYWSKSHEY